MHTTSRVKPTLAGLFLLIIPIHDNHHAPFVPLPHVTPAAPLSLAVRIWVPPPLPLLRRIVRLVTPVRVDLQSAKVDQTG